jgi:Na+-transporting NADH:ubiquinone oxidoreductase subunit NqrF
MTPERIAQLRRWQSKPALQECLDYIAELEERIKCADYERECTLIYNEQLRTKVKELRALIDKPQIIDFLEAVQRESAHHYPDKIGFCRK